jgi:hypothetical protein
MPAEPDPLPAELLGLTELFDPPIELPLLPAPAAPAFGAVRVADEPVVIPLRSDLPSRFISFGAMLLCWADGVGDPGCVGVVDCAAANDVERARASVLAMIVFFMGSSLHLS